MDESSYFRIASDSVGLLMRTVSASSCLLLVGLALPLVGETADRRHEAVAAIDDQAVVRLARGAARGPRWLALSCFHTRPAMFL